MLSSFAAWPVRREILRCAQDDSKASDAPGPQADSHSLKALTPGPSPNVGRGGLFARPGEGYPRC